MAITSFKKTYAYLSNFYAREVEYEGKVYATAEHAFQAAKATCDEDREAVLAKKTPAAAKKVGQDIKLRDDWKEVRVDIMREILRAKFSDKQLASKLIDTGDEELIERNSWGDVFWGECKGSGENQLGKLLMEIRNELTPQKPESTQKNEYVITGQTGVVIETSALVSENAETVAGIPVITEDFDPGSIDKKEPTLKELRDQLSDAGLPIEGTKAELKERVNSTFGRQDTSNFHLIDPPPFGAECKSCGAPLPDMEGEDPYVCARCASGEKPLRPPLVPIIPDPNKNRIIPPDPEDTPTARAIMATYKRDDDLEKRSETINMGILGDDCARKIWYKFRWALNTEFSEKTLRIFERGNIEEDRIISSVKKAGIKVWSKRFEVDGNHYVLESFENGMRVWYVYTPKGMVLSRHDSYEEASSEARKQDDKQIKVTSLCGHLGGRLDFIGLGFPEAPKTPHVAEVKSANKSNYNKVKKDGVEKTKPEHFGQMQSYMRELGLKRAIYIVSNKDTEEIHTERVYYDKAKADALFDRALEIIKSQSPPDRIGKDASFWKCKFCDFKDICHDVTPPDVNCRTCIFSTPVVDDNLKKERPEWTCDRGGYSYPLPKVVQVKGCVQHLFIPDLLSPEFSFVRAENDSAPSWISYTDRNGNAVLNVTETAILRSSEAAAFTSREFEKMRDENKPIRTSSDYAELRKTL